MMGDDSAIVICLIPFFPLNECFLAVGLTLLLYPVFTRRRLCVFRAGDASGRGMRPVTISNFYGVARGGARRRSSSRWPCLGADMREQSGWGNVSLVLLLRRFVDQQARHEGEEASALASTLRAHRPRMAWLRAPRSATPAPAPRRPRMSCIPSKARLQR